MKRSLLTLDAEVRGGLSWLRKRRKKWLRIIRVSTSMQWEFFFFCTYVINTPALGMSSLDDESVHIAFTSFFFFFGEPAVGVDVSVGICHTHRGQIV